jgi:aldehyde:ferredoxin oxidoreductase
MVGVRHSHLDNGGYSIDQTALQTETTPVKMAQAIAAEDSWRCILNSLVICLFARPVFTGDVVVRALGALGQKRTLEDLKRLGEEIFHEKMRFKVQEGFDLNRLEAPPRLLETLSPHGRIDKATLTDMIGAWRKAHNL